MVKLVDCLKSELRERQPYVLNEKIKRTALSEKPATSKKDGGPPRPKDKSGKFSSTPTDTAEKYPCSICGKSEGHVVTLNKDCKPCIEYIACKAFVDIDASGRDKLLFKKHRCQI